MNDDELWALWHKETKQYLTDDDTGVPYLFADKIEAENYLEDVRLPNFEPIEVIIQQRFR